MRRKIGSLLLSYRALIDTRSDLQQSLHFQGSSTWMLGNRSSARAICVLRSLRTVLRSSSCFSNSSIKISLAWCSRNLLHSWSIKNILSDKSSRRLLKNPEQHHHIWMRENPETTKLAKQSLTYLFSNGRWTRSWTRLMKPWRTSLFNLKQVWVNERLKCNYTRGLFTCLITSSRTTVGSSQISNGCINKGSWEKQGKNLVFCRALNNKSCTSCHLCILPRQFHQTPPPHPPVLPLPCW
jgi:hypothetical protein